MKNSSELGIVSYQLREWVHKASDSVFVAKGFVEDLENEIRTGRYLEPDFDQKDFRELAAAVLRNIEKIDANLDGLRHFAKQEMFIGGLPNAPESDPSKKETSKWK